MTRANGLFTEAVEVGLIDENNNGYCDKLQDYINILSKAMDWVPNDINPPNNDNLNGALNKLDNLKKKKNRK